MPMTMAMMTLFNEGPKTAIMASTMIRPGKNKGLTLRGGRRGRNCCWRTSHTDDREEQQGHEDHSFGLA